MGAFRAAIFTRSALVALFSFFAVVALAANIVRFETDRLTLETPDGRKAMFTVELAIDDSQRMQGLMHRESMPADHGMLFDFGESRLVTMWMRNTILPLDMLFIDEKGRVQHLREHTVPFSEELISSMRPVRYVVELNAGTAKRLGIGVGSRAHWGSLRKSD